MAVRTDGSETYSGGRRLLLDGGYPGRRRLGHRSGQSDEGHFDRHRGGGGDCYSRLADRSKEAESRLANLPARPDYPPDAIQIVDPAIRPVRIGGIVGLNGRPAAGRMERKALHDEGLVRTKDVNPVA